MPSIAARHSRRRSRWPATLLSLCVILGLVGCTRPGAVSPVEQSAAAAPPPGAATLSISPASGAVALPVSTEIGLTLADGELAGVRLVKAGTDQELAGMLRPDGSSWVPLRPLEYGTAYEATVTAKGHDGQLVSRTTTFTTMPAPGRYVDTGLYAFNGQTVGVAMPIVVQFDREIPQESRAAIQERLFVTTDPPQPGVWSWVGGRQVLYRAPDYWQPGTTITVRSALKGVPIGSAFGDADREATVTVSENKVFMYVDNRAKHMQVYINDTLVRTMPVSLGKPRTPSSSGFMVTMTREPWATFDTRGEPNGGYVVDVQWAHRLTWGGEFIHSAPWSVGSQGRTNVSHGCINLAPANAKWLFDQIHVGTPIIVNGTERTLQWGNGWTAWARPWSEYIKGSALPVPDELANAPAVDHLTGAPPPRPAPSPEPTTSSSPAPSHSVDPAAVPT